MSDQAAALRAMAAVRRQLAGHQEGSALVFASGKGGVGKSLLAILAARALAERGLEVLLLDGAQNLGNLHVLLGIVPERRLDDVLDGEAHPTELLCRVGEHLWLLPADSGAPSLYTLSRTDQARLHHRLSAVYDVFDLAVVDAGSGLHAAVRVAAMRARRMVVVTAPEPAALANSYALIKVVGHQLPQLPVDVVVNRVSETGEGEAAFERLATASQKFLRRTLCYAGSIPEDPVLRIAARRPGAVLQDAVQGPAWEAMQEIVARLGDGIWSRNDAVAGEAI